MAKLTAKMIKAIMPYAPTAKVNALLPVITATAIHYEITTARRLQMWLATLAIESGELKYTSELGTHPEYEGRKDLGNTQKGDGVKFEGHGFIQLTGRGVHTAYTNYLRKSGHLPFVDFTVQTDRLALAPYAMDSAGWFVNGYKNLNPLADDNHFKTYQIRVNGQNQRTGNPNHWTERQEYFRRAKLAIPADFVLTAEDVQPDAVVAEIEAMDSTAGYPDFEIPATALKPNTDTPNGLDDAIPILTAENGSEGQETPATGKVDEWVAIEKAPKQGFWGKIYAKITAATGGSIFSSGLTEKAAQAQTLGLSADMWWLIFKLALVGALIWIISEVYQHWQWKKEQKEKDALLVKANSVEGMLQHFTFADKDDLPKLKEHGYRIVERGK